MQLKTRITQFHDHKINQNNIEQTPDHSKSVMSELKHFYTAAWQSAA